MRESFVAAVSNAIENGAEVRSTLVAASCGVITTSFVPDGIDDEDGEIIVFFGDNFMKVIGDIIQEDDHTFFSQSANCDLSIEF